MRMQHGLLRLRLMLHDRMLLLAAAVQQVMRWQLLRHVRIELVLVLRMLMQYVHMVDLLHLGLDLSIDALQCVADQHRTVERLLRDLAEAGQFEH